MTIRIYNNKIEFDDGSNVYTLSETTRGFTFTGNFASPGWVTSSPINGINFGFTSGGAPSGGNQVNIIDRFPFASNANATDYGDLTLARYMTAGQSSSTDGYTAGGYNPSLSPVLTNVIDKFPFASAANATDVGDLTASRGDVTGQSSSTHGFTSGSVPVSNVIDRFPFATNANATDYGDLTVGRSGTAGQSSTSDGYNSGGSPNSNVIDKFPFASAANATDVGDITVARYYCSGQSSTVSGYSSAGQNSSATVFNTIDKFPFATNASATDVGDATVARNYTAGVSSSTYGYISGGIPASNVIDSFPFASNANASDVGDLTASRGSAAGQQD